MRTIPSSFNILAPGFNPETAGATLQTEHCPYHPGIEFPIWLCCPKCREESEAKLRANHYIAQRRAGVPLATILADEPSFDLSVEEDEHYTDADCFEREMADPSTILLIYALFFVAGAVIGGAVMWTVWLR